MKSSYDECLRRLLAHEGGYSNHPADPGGPTNFGITLADYRRYVKPGASAADVRAMRVEEAKTIYRAKYWNALRCDELPAGVDDSVFDYGVNSGIGRAGKVLRRVLGLADADYRVSDDVLAALAKRDAREVVKAINDERLRFLKSLKTWPTFGPGWSRRVDEVRIFSIVLAAGAPGPIPAKPAPGKGQVPAPSPAEVAKPAAPAALVLGGLAEWMGAHPALTALAVVGVVVVAVAVFGALRKRRDAQQEAPTPGVAIVPVMP